MDDQKAMIELLRVLSDTGFALIDVPIDYSRADTYEDFSITSPAERTKAFCQWDHVRLYGRDFAGKLERAGFKVSADGYIDSLGQAMIEFHGLERHPICFCTR